MTEIAEKVNCTNCGGPLKLEAGEVIVTCEYCGAALNMAVGKKYFLRHAIIPNRYSPEQVSAMARQWMGGGFLKPEDLARKAQIRELFLTFLPFFVVHVAASSKYEGVLTRTGQNIPKKGDFTREYHWKILGRRASAFPTKEYEIPLSGKVDFDLAHVSKNAKFLNAEMDEREAQTRLRQEIEEHHKFLLSSEMDVIQTIKTDLEIKNTEFVHAPAWFLKYEYKQKLYELIFDGASGVVVKGDIPAPDDTSTKGFFKKMLGG
ncbi:MAG: hypothetical protein JSV56_13455 [Methanomassiliicoccales archaeon]|nr:MAG: hypothetical protein JSV56_13455 [Methanomassiliicoccales archaeon]